MSSIGALYYDCGRYLKIKFRFEHSVSLFYLLLEALCFLLDHPPFNSFLFHELLLLFLFDKMLIKLLSILLSCAVTPPVALDHSRGLVSKFCISKINFLLSDVLFLQLGLIDDFRGEGWVKLL